MRTTIFGIVTLAKIYEYSCFLLSFVLFVIKRKIIGLNTGTDPISLLFKLVSQTGEFIVLTRPVCL